jgi:hypothetical protein
MQNTPEPGPIIAVYQTRRLQFHHFGWLILCGVLFVLFPLVCGLFRLYSGYTQYGPAAGYARGFPWLILSIFAFVTWTFALILRLRSPRYKILLCKNGLQFEGKSPVRIKSGSGDCLKWGSINGVSYETIRKKTGKGQPFSKTSRTEYRYNEIARQNATLFLTNGERISISESPDLPGGVINLPELISRIKARLYPRLFPEFKTAFDAGKWLCFGRLQVHKEGLKFRTGHAKQPDVPVSWYQIRHITVKSGFLVVELNGPTNPTVKQKRFPISQIPNLELLLQLIKDNVEG